MKKQMPYSAPEGYFEGLQTRLAEIPARRSRFNVMPYLALAASFAIALLAGNYILMKTTASQPASDDEIIEYLIDSGMTLAQLEDAVYEY